MASEGRRYEKARRPVEGFGPAALVDLFLHPHRGWRRVAAAPASVGSLMVGWAMPLAAVPAVAGLVHDSVFGRGSTGIIQYRPTAIGALTTAVAVWLLSLLAVALLAFVIAAVAPRLGGRGDRVAAFKVAVLGSSAFFLAGAFVVLPVIDLLQLAGLYSLFLIGVGAPVLMRVPDERRGGFGGGVAGLAAVLAIALLVGGGAIAARSLVPTVRTAEGRKVVTSAPAIGVALSAPATSKKGPAPGTAAAAAAAGGAVPASSLQALLPATIAGFRRTATESQSNVSGGVASAAAKGTYVAGTNSFTLTVTDAGQPGALATSDSVVAGEVNRVTDSGYQRSRVVNGVRVAEKWTNADHGGSYSRSVAGRFTVEAQGTAPSIATLRGAVAGVDPNALAALNR